MAQTKAQTKAQIKPIKPIKPIIKAETQQQTQHVKVSIRLPGGIVTSLTIKKNIIALWILFAMEEKIDDIDDIDEAVVNGQVYQKLPNIPNQLNDFIYECMSSWEKETGKGLSDYVTECLIKDFLDDDYELYCILKDSV